MCDVVHALLVEQVTAQCLAVLSGGGDVDVAAELDGLEARLSAPFEEVDSEKFQTLRSLGLR